MTMLWAAALLLAAMPQPGPTITVWRCSQQHPVRLEIELPRRHVVSVNGDALQLDGIVVAPPLQFDEVTWRSIGRDGSSQRDRSTLSVQAHDGELQLIAALPLEPWVARVVAAESLPGTADAALRAQAIVSRSYALAGNARHSQAQLCDLAHCASLMASKNAALAAASRQAAEATQGLVLHDARGAILRAVFHRSCGGVTANPHSVFGGQDDTGAAVHAELECANDRWATVVLRVDAEQAAARAIGLSDRPAWQQLRLEFQPDGRLARVLDTVSGRFATGDNFVRAMDSALGWGVVHSTQFRWRAHGDQIVLEGKGSGHGVGLCQRGAARWASRGDTAAQILRRYFPQATIAPFNSVQPLRTTPPEAAR